jgi:hypothetical protein
MCVYLGGFTAQVSGDNSRIGVFGYAGACSQTQKEFGKARARGPDLQPDGDQPVNASTQIQIVPSGGPVCIQCPHLFQVCPDG